MSATVSNTQPKDFYVYEHRRAVDGVTFYVGKGARDRAWVRAGRSAAWHQQAGRGYVVHIVEHGLQEWAALEIECGLIALYGRSEIGYGSLVNQTDGGDGVFAACLKPRPTDSEAYEAKRQEIQKRWADAQKWIRKRGAKGKSHGGTTNKSVICVDTGARFTSIKAAAEWVRRETGIEKANSTTITRCMRGVVVSAYGYRWKYEDQK